MLIASRQNANWFFFLFDSTFSLRSVYGMASSDRQRPSPKTHKHKCRCSHKHTKLQKSVFNIISFFREKKHLRRRRGFFRGKKNSAEMHSHSVSSIDFSLHFVLTEEWHSKSFIFVVPKYLAFLFLCIEARFFNNHFEFDNLSLTPTGPHSLLLTFAL